MAVAAGVLNEQQKRTLEALCDTWVPALDPDGADPVEAGFFARPAGEMGVADQIEGLMADAMTPDEIAATGELLDALADEDFAALPLAGRVDLVSATAASSFDARHGLHALKGLTLMFFYALPDEQGLNPNWEALGYPGPNSAPPPAAEAPKTISIADVSGPTATLTADVCVVGSGAGGAVVAAGCAQAGLSVLVLEMGAYRNEADFKQLEIPGMFELYLGGGLLTSEDGSIAVLAGSTLGGGTVVNYMNCIRTPQHIRDEWAQHGLDGIDAPEYERDHIDAVSERLGTNTEMTRQNGTHQLLMKGLDALGMEHRPIVRNASPDRRPGVLRVLRDGVSARVQALHDEDVAAGRLGRGRPVCGAVPCRSGPGRGRSRGGSRRDRHTRRRQRDGADHRGADRRGRVRWCGVARRCCCARASAARRSASTCACTPLTR